MSITRAANYHFFTFLFLMVTFPLSAADDWTEQSPATSPGGRFYHDIAYLGDDKVLLFGGYDGSTDRETWIYDLSDNNWTHVSSIGPAARVECSLAYIANDHVLVFGGWDSSPPRFDDTWIYDRLTNTWSNMNPASKPSGRRGYSISYIGDDKVLLFGGEDSGGRDDETWVYDLSANTWTNMDPGTWVAGTDMPTGRVEAGMAYFGDDQVLLFGGLDASTTTDETWIYDLSANTWTQLSPTASPSARYYCEMAYMGNKQVLLFGGQNWNSDTQIYDQATNTWINDPNTASPDGRFGHGIAETDLSGNSNIVLFGGNTLADGTSDDTWTFGGGDYALPVELSSFTVESTNQGTLCKWMTESEIENLGFILERKTEGTNWSELVSYKTDDGLMGQGTISSPTNYEFMDTFVEPNATYEYRLADVDYNRVITYHSVRAVTVGNTIQSSLVKEFTVLPAYPNPFNPVTTITYGIDNDSKVNISIYDIAGQLITTLFNTDQTRGWHSVIWNGTNQSGEQAPAGLYLSRVISGNEVKTAKLMLLK